ncbi:MAG: restriction endonuclease [Deltaproteobacteria bacterium]|nr:restriction endonuclease [Deltaproteobacteria bacterium]
MTNGLDFERQVHALLKKMGFEAEVTKASGDGGVDIIAQSKDHIISGRYVIQCKDWSKPVGEPPIRDLYGVVTAENANKGILITTSIFTAPALKFAEGKPLELIDGTKFNQLLTKYSVAGSQGVAMDIVEDERINELTEQLNNNPKNIFILKEIADIYLLRGDYNKAVEFYEMLIPLNPSIETERLNNAYRGGLINYGVALAKLKRYDDALKAFKENNLNLNEAHLTHYLGLYDIAISIYQKFKSVDNPSDWDEMIDKAYVQTQLDFPCLGALVSKDGNDEWTIIPLETATEKVRQEKDRYARLFMPIADTIDEFAERWIALRTMIEIDQYLGRSEEDYQYEAESMLALENKCLTIISDSNDIMNVATTNALQESYREYLVRQITLATLVYDSILKFKKYLSDSFDSVDHGNLTDSNTDYELWKQGLLECLDSSISAFHNKIIEDESLGMGFIEEEKKVTAIYEATIEKEKTEWREKLRKTLYSNQAPMERGNIPFAQYRHGEP